MENKIALMLCDLIEKIIVRTQGTKDALGNTGLREEMVELNKIKSELSRISGTIGSRRAFKYFIEDTRSQKWLTIGEPFHHSSKHGVLSDEESRWTNDPLMAISFDSFIEAEKHRKLYWDMHDIKVTEHEFVNHYQSEREVADFLHDCAYNFDHDTDAHKYGGLCRACEAERILKLINKPNTEQEVQVSDTTMLNSKEEAGEQKIKTLTDWIMEVACDFAWENNITKSEGYQKIKLLYSLWIQENGYHRKQLSQFEQLQSENESLKQLLKEKQSEAVEMLVKLIRMKLHKDEFGKTPYYEENQPLTWKEAFDWYVKFENKSVTDKQ